MAVTLKSPASCEICTLNQRTQPAQQARHAVLTPDGEDRLLLCCEHAESCAWENELQPGLCDEEACEICGLTWCGHSHARVYG